MAESTSGLVPESVNPTDKDLIDKTFVEAKDFRTLGERITAPLDSIIGETAKVLDRDPILSVSKELEGMHLQMQRIYAEIIDNDGALLKFFKSIPMLGSVVQKMDSAFDTAVFNLKDVEGKIASLFSGFDQSYSSLTAAIDMQRTLLTGIEGNLSSVIAYKDYLAEKIEEFRDQLSSKPDGDLKTKYQMFLRNVEFFQSNLVVLIGNLQMARQRLLIRLDSSDKLSLAMNSSKPIFKVLISSAVIEVSGQKAIDASLKAMQSMGQTIDKMSSDLTQRAIDTHKRAEEITSQPVLSSSVFIENVTKLKNHFDEMETYRQQLLVNAESERKNFASAEEKLSNLKTLSREDADELKQILDAGAN